MELSSNISTHSGFAKPNDGVKRLKRSFTNMSNKSLKSSFSISSFTKETIFHGTKRPKQEHNENEDNLTSLEVKYTKGNERHSKFIQLRNESVQTLPYPKVGGNGSWNNSDSRTDLMSSLKKSRTRESFGRFRRSALPAFTYSEGITTETQQAESVWGTKGHRFGRIFEPSDKCESVSKSPSEEIEEFAESEDLKADWRDAPDGSFLQKLSKMWQARNKDFKINIASMKSGLMRKFHRGSVLGPRDINISNHSNNNTKDTFDPIKFDETFGTNQIVTRPKKIKMPKIPTITQPAQEPPKRETEECVLDTVSDTEISGALLYILNNSTDDLENATPDLSQNLTIVRSAESISQGSLSDIPNCKLRIDDLPDEMESLDVSESHFLDVETMDDASDCPSDNISLI